MNSKTHFQAQVTEIKPLGEPIATLSPKLTGSVQLTLHTDMANRLFDGTWQWGRMGLIQFAKLMGTLFKAFKEDDPYAEMFLLKIFDVISETLTEMKTVESQLDAQLNNLRNFKVELFSNPSPFIHALQFASPFAFMAATLLEEVDYLLRQLFTLRRLGLKAEKELNTQELVQRIQKIFNNPREWRYTGVTRQDIHLDNPKAKKAKELLGQIPIEILNKEIQFSFLPRLKEGIKHDN